MKVTYLHRTGGELISIEPAYVGYVAQSDEYDACQDPECTCRHARGNLTGWGLTPEAAFEDLIEKYEEYA